MPRLKMRIGENLSPFWRRVAAVLVLLQHTLLFIAAISAAWGWYVVGFGSCLMLMAGLFDQRHVLRSAIRSNAGKSADRLIAIYGLLLGLIAVIVNVALIGFWIAKRVG